MSALQGLFKKAVAVEAAPSSGFKIGGAGRLPVEQGSDVTPGLAVTPVTAASSPANPSPAAAKSLGGFKIAGGGGGTPPTKQESAGKAVDPPPVQAAQPSAPATPSGPLPGETPASAPQREITTDVSDEVKRFIANLDHLHTLAPEPELATSAIRGIMMELKQQPQYMKHISDSDVRVMIQMMRETMGLTRVVKEQKAVKRTAKTNANTQAVMDELADLNFL